MSELDDQTDRRTKHRKVACPACGYTRYSEPNKLCTACHRLRLLMEPVGDWVEHALCAQTDPEVWFPTHRGGTNKAASVAQKICDQCPVKQECKEYANRAREEWGVWGGETEIERRKALRNQGDAA